MEISKGKFDDVDISNIVKQIHESDINIIANYIFGLLGDSMETMRKTLNLSKKQKTLACNAYTAMLLPGSRLYKDAVENLWELPDDYTGFSFHAFI